MAFISGFGPAVKRCNAVPTCPRTSVIVADGKGFGGGEATRDPEPTSIDPNDPKGKQKAIHKADSFEEYMKKRKEAQEQGK
mmetsp:Transcript_4467/g.13550  ORF Transcript_4467/g.13550 Transcript_4467/m.13550 type:complete len:81 (+) Transcript_4467:58-300(+)|eukprot:CAMPEP_0198723598 /NCGR_PEP_ID=MMETSP1475-20131203/1091_1 /TAXON_ID= ORGANISM="Unidentified sp., Strain CCMP1999" /NCGR_SAMPLE_ID=MMETSP1475 /ASSEMBLY_ACC=CAM_ASM_001111 /LENGTH=80 /DNA_ID=CAMNT_0044484805 /DNA_START=64 /DNA_END=306 /DNA_ORIENTATION=-